MNNQNLSITEEIINLFVHKERRGRFTELFSKPKRHSDGLWDLLHDPRYFDEKVITKIPATEYTPELIFARLKKLGFQSKCYVISHRFDDLAEKLMPTTEAIKTIGNTDSMLFCPISKIGYYEGHEGWRYILRSTQNK